MVHIHRQSFHFDTEDTGPFTGKVFISHVPSFFGMGQYDASRTRIALPSKYAADSASDSASGPAIFGIGARHG